MAGIPMRLSLAGGNFIMGWESLRLQAYLDSRGVPTIGWGHTGSDVNMGDTIDIEGAEELFNRDISRPVTALNASLAMQPTQSQFDALVSITFNCGIGAPGRADGIIWLATGNHSGLLTLFNAGDPLGACAEFAKWHKSGDRRIAGLLNRRIAEMALFMKKD